MMSGSFGVKLKFYRGRGRERATQNAVTYEQRGVTKLEKQIAIAWRSVIVCDSIVFCLLAVSHLRFGLHCWKQCGVKIQYAFSSSSVCTSNR